MKTPLILITSGRAIGELSQQRRQSELYASCLHTAGGLGVLASGGNASALAARFDGLLLSGGGDLRPALYGQTPCPGVPLSIDPVRDAEEDALFHAFLARRKPILGICRGIQAINVFLGGTLRQHIDGHNYTCHPLTCGAELHSLLGGEPKVNSYHHQAVDRPGDGLHILARAPDGVIEAIQHESLPILAVQWHPERMVPPLCQDVEGQNHLAVFRWLLEHA